METGNAEPSGLLNDGDCVVRVSATRRDGRTATGTGCLVDRQARVVTCAHVVADASELRVHVVGYPRPWRYVVLRASTDDDVAILEPEGKVAGAPRCAVLHPDWKHDVDVGDAVSAWGYSSFEHFETEAQRFACTISSFSANTGLIGLNATINPGDSGGPIFDEHHRVIGIVAARDAERQGQAMGIPVSLVLRVASDLLDLEPVDMPAARIAGDLPTSDRGYPVLGRDELLERLRAGLVAGHHQSLVVLPGIGKTTLATILVNDAAVAAHFEGILWANVGRKFNVEAQLRGWAGMLGISLAGLKDSADPVEALKAATKQAIGSRRMLMVLDDVWEVSAAEAFMSLGRNCVFLSTTREIDIATELLKGPKWVAVRSLPTETGLALLTAIAPGAVALDTTATRSLVDAVSGLPLALVLIGKYLAANDWGDPAQLRFALTRMGKAGERLALAVSKERSLWSIIDVSYAALGEESLQQAFLALSIFRPDPHAFTAEMAEHICDVPREAFQPLHNMGLIEFRRAPDADGEDGYTMHRVLTEFGRDRLANRSSLEIPRLHAKAVRYYAERMNEDIEHDPAAYLSKYRFEDRDWQRLKEAWLYHLAQTGDSVVALRAFLRVWFDAFWWWGYYQRFPFCARLVAEWGSREIDDRARVGLGQVATFEAWYPAGYDKRGGGDWTKVRAALLAIRDGMRLDGPVESLPDADARLLRAFTEFFLAEATGYGPAPDTNAALALYRSAHALFIAAQAPWEATWALFYVAQFLQDQGDAAQAIPFCRSSLDEALGVAKDADVDPELLANGYRLLGELTFGGDRADASATFDAWHHAVFHAYAFQAYPQRADSYTLAFYDEITSRIAGSLVTRHRAGDPAAADVASRLHVSWAASGDGQAATVAAALASGDAPTLARTIFPSGVSPAADDVARVVAAVERMRASLPDARLPPRDASSATPAPGAGASNTVNQE